MIRRRLECRGAVQGVGFRPAVHRLAGTLELGGWVRNDPDGAAIEVEGPPEAVTEFAAQLTASLPPLARLDSMETREVAPLGERAFSVRASESGARRRARIPPDAALCNACRAELEDPGDRRHRYPFTTCTDCGPRFSLTRTLPYDRERTSMACFPLCDACRVEYEDPGSRRFHAEPICCPACGPRLWLADGRGRVRGEGPSALAAAREALAAGAILAVKGLGGFQLACRADDPAALGRLRARKRRPTKPLALMVRDVAGAGRLVRIGGPERALLCSVEAPIVLAPRVPGCPVPEEAAPGLDDLGVMLATTPLHLELFRDAPFPALVMTSGNASDEPICRGNREALARLGAIADLLLLHDRDVVRRVDDSLVRAADGDALVVRRSRGFTPCPVALPEPASEPILALGGHLQATACVAVGGQAFPSQHVGDLESEGAREFLVEAAGDLERLLEVTPSVVAVDLHPDYPSAWIGARLARERGGRLLRVQHHLAHAAAVLAERRAFPSAGERAAALVLDGTGFGSDGTAWGCEWLLIDGALGWRRCAHGASLPLVGGERAVREPWRVAVAALAATGRAGCLEALPLAGRVDPGMLARVAELAAGDAWPRASGAGRVFEAAGALLGLAAANGWEGEAAARLESAAARAPGAAEPWPEVRLPDDRDQLPAPELLAAAAERVAGGEDPARVAAGFHASFAHLAAALTARVLPDDVRRIALGGGCLVNRILRRALARELAARGLTPLLPREIPPGDGGLAYGQAALAAVALARNTTPVEGGP